MVRTIPAGVSQRHLRFGVLAGRTAVFPVFFLGNVCSISHYPFDSGGSAAAAGGDAVWVAAAGCGWVIQVVARVLGPLTINIR